MPDRIDEAAASSRQHGPFNGQPVIVEDTSQNPVPYGGGTTVKMDGQGNPVKPADQKTQPSQPGIDRPENLDQKGEEAYKRMQADYTRKTQQLAELRRESEEKIQMLNAMLAQQQNSAQSTQGASPATSAEERMAQKVLGHQWEALDSEQRAAWGNVENMINAMKDQVVSDLRKETQSYMNNGQQLIEQLQTEIAGMRTQQGMASLKSQYGEDIIAPLEQHIHKICCHPQYRGITPEQALDAIAPHVRQEYWVRVGEQRAAEQLKQQQVSSSSSGHAFPSAPISEDFKLGESMEQTGLRAMRQIAPDLIGKYTRD